MSGLKGERRSVSFGFLDEAGDLARLRDLDDAELGDLVGRDGQGGDGDVGAGVAVLLLHQGVVHLVDVVAGEDEDVLGLFGADGVDVLEDGVGGALVPGLGDALHGGEDLDELAELGGDDRPPALADVAVERERLVLGEDVDVAQVGVDAVRQRDVDDAVLPGEGDGGLGAIACEGKQALARAASQIATPNVSLMLVHPSASVRAVATALRTSERRCDAKSTHLRRPKSSTGRRPSVAQGYSSVELGPLRHG